MALFLSPAVRATDADGDTLNGAKWNFYYSGGLVRAPIYTTSARTIQHANPVIADSGGAFASIYLDPSISYRAVLTNSTGSETYKDVDPYEAGSGASALGLLFSEVSTNTIPNDVNVFETAGYSAEAAGPARYRYDATIDASYVSTWPRFAVRDPAGRGFRIAEKTITPFMVGGVNATGTPFQQGSEAFTDNTDVIQDMFDYSAHRAFVEPVDLDFAGTWGITGTITITGDFQDRQTFYMGRFVYIGTSAIGNLFVVNASYCQFKGRWMVHGYPTSTRDALALRYANNGIYLGACEDSFFEYLYLVGFKRFGVETDPTKNQIGCRIGMLYHNYCGSFGTSTLTDSSVFTATHTGSGGSNLQRSVLTCDAAFVASKVIGDPVKIAATGDTHIVKAKPTATTIEVFPWVYDGASAINSGTVYGRQGGGIHIDGSDSCMVRVDQIDGHLSAVGWWSSGLYGISVGRQINQSGWAPYMIGFGSDNNCIGNTIEELHCEGMEKYGVVNTSTQINFKVGNMRSVNSDTIFRPFDNFDHIAAHSGTANGRAAGLYGVAICFNGQWYESGYPQGSFSDSTFTPHEWSNDPRLGGGRGPPLVITEDGPTINLDYAAGVARHFAGHYHARAFIMGSGTNHRPTGTITVTRNSNVVAAGITLNGGTSSITFTNRTREADLRAILDNSASPKNLIVWDANAQELTGSATWDPGSIANGASATTTVTVTGAVLGDIVDGISLGVSLAGLSLTGFVSAADTVTAVLSNATGGAVDLTSSTLRVRVTRI